jgi:hypothetical protein
MGPHLKIIKSGDGSCSPHILGAETDEGSDKMQRIFTALR